MPPSNRYHIDEIVSKVITILTDFTLPVPHGLAVKKVQYGGIEYLPTPTIPTDIIPIIFVKPVSGESAHGQPLVRITNDWALRIVYVRKFLVGEVIPQVKVQELVRIANKLTDNFLLTGLVLSDGYGILSGLVSGFEFEPPEDDIAAATSSDIAATALRVEFKESGRRS